MFGLQYNFKYLYNNREVFNDDSEINLNIEI